MAIQFPGQINHLSASDMQDTRQRQTHNALVNDSLQQKNEQTQTQFDQGKALEAAQMFIGVAQKGKEALSRNPNAWAEILPNVVESFKVFGIPTEKIPPAGAAYETVLDGLNKLEQLGQMQLSGQPQPQIGANDLVKVQGENGPVYAAAPDAVGQGVPQSTVSQAKDPASISEYKLYMDQAIASGQEPMSFFDFRKEISAQQAAGRTGGSLDAEIDRTDSVADSRSTVAGAVSFAQQDNKQRAQSIQSAVESVQKIDTNTSNLDRAVAALDEGAQSGPVITQYTPTLRAASIELEQVRNSLGLDVIGAVTFGALSKGEMELALKTAMPPLPPKELRQWILDKKAANDKLRDYYMEQVDWLRNGGSVDTFMQHKEELKDARGGGDFQSQWDAAASGTVLQAPDGTMRKKP